MDRLTEYVDGEVRQVQNVKVGHKACMRKLAAYEDTGLEPKEVNAVIWEKYKLRELLRQIHRELDLLAWDNPETFCNGNCCMGYPDECLRCDDDYSLLRLALLNEIEEVLKND
jgi:hypothetical protein